MEPNIFKYIWHHSKQEQVAILLLVLLSLPFYFIALDVPKRIINRGIVGAGFDGPGSAIFAVAGRSPTAWSARTATSPF